MAEHGEELILGTARRLGLHPLALLAPQQRLQLSLGALQRLLRGMLLVNHRTQAHSRQRQHGQERVEDQQRLIR